MYIVWVCSGFIGGGRGGVKIVGVLKWGECEDDHA